jgi:hypothetical protein
VENHARQAAGQAAETQVAVVDHRQRGTVVGAIAGFAHFALDRRHQAADAVAEHYVVRARAHGARSGLFVGRVGNDDEGQVQVEAVQHLQGANRRQPVQVEQVQYGIPGAVAQGGAPVASVT